MKKSKEEIYESLVLNSSSDDVEKIDKKIGGMKRGKLAKIWDKVMSLYAVIKDKNASKTAKMIAIGALLYVILPLDAIPDVIPILGLGDDVGIIILAVTKLAASMKKK